MKSGGQSKKDQCRLDINTNEQMIEDYQTKAEKRWEV